MFADQQKEKAVEIVTADRIDRILRKVCSASLEVLIRAPGVNNLAVRGRAASIEILGENVCFRICNVSEQGMAHLKRLSKMRIEFVGMTTQVFFESSILSRDQGSIGVLMPTLLSSVERRENARHVAKAELPGFLKFGSWLPGKDDLCSPPIVSPYNDMAGWINIADISEGGFCAVSRFPSILNTLRRGMIDDRALVILPMQAPIPAALEIRWFKKLKERVDVEGATRFIRSYRFGVQFVSPNEQTKMAVKQYIKQLSLAEAI